MVGASLPKAPLLSRKLFRFRIWCQCSLSVSFPSLTSHILAEDNSSKRKLFIQKKKKLKLFCSLLSCYGSIWFKSGLLGSLHLSPNFHFIWLSMLAFSQQPNNFTFTFFAFTSIIFFSCRKLNRIARWPFFQLLWI